jgi:hypothetical protein
MTTVTETITLGVSDLRGRELGTVAIESVQNGLVAGEFAPGPDYAEVEPAFRALADMVDQNSFHFIDEVMGVIAQLGVTIRADPSRPPIRVHDVQIYPDGGFSCRLPSTGMNGKHSG